MNCEEVKNVIGELIVLYPERFKKMKKEDVRVLLNCWGEVFNGIPYRTVKKALLSYYKKNTGFCPVPGAIYSLIPEKELYGEEFILPTIAWNMVKEQIDDASHSCSAFNSWPKELQEAVGNYKKLGEWSKLPENYINSKLKDSVTNSYIELCENKRKKQENVFNSITLKEMSFLKLEGSEPNENS